MGHKHEPRLGIEAPHSHLIQALCPAIFIIVWILDTLVFKFSIVLNDFVPWIVRLILFIGVIAVAYAFIYISNNILFQRPENKDEIIAEGILGHVRNPMYLGILLIYLAFIFFSISLISIATWIVIIVIYDKLATSAEKQLEKLFGVKYLKYKKNVPKWIPR